MVVRIRSGHFESIQFGHARVGRCEVHQLGVLIGENLYRPSLKSTLAPCNILKRLVFRGAAMRGGSARLAVSWPIPFVLCRALFHKDAHFCLAVPGRSRAVIDTRFHIDPNSDLGALCACDAAGTDPHSKVTDKNKKASCILKNMLDSRIRFSNSLSNGLIFFYSFFRERIEVMSNCFAEISLRRSRIVVVRGFGSPATPHRSSTVSRQAKKPVIYRF